MNTIQNKTVVRDFFSSFELENADRILSLMTDDATWWVNGKPHLFSFAGLKSKADMTPILYGLFALFDGGLKMEVKRLIAEEDCVAAESRSFGNTKNGRHYENEYHIFFRLREGRIVEIREYTDPMHAVETFN